MAKQGSKSQVKTPESSMVVYCLIGDEPEEGAELRFLLIEKQGSLSFPPTKLGADEDLYHALKRPMEEDLGLPNGSYFLEKELPMIERSSQSANYPGLVEHWFLYPVALSLGEDGRESVNRLAKTARGRALKAKWLTLDEIATNTTEPNVLRIADELRKLYEDKELDVLGESPSMNARACEWFAVHEGGVRVVRGKRVEKILEAGDRAFNLRAADPFLPYQSQGLGFTWSFFTPKDKQDVHVHSLPAVEIYGVLKGSLQLWFKPMNHRGAGTWKNKILEAGDWAEVEPLNCHFACWLKPEGIGTVIKAAAAGDLAGVGPLGISGKTTCKDCNVQQQCALHPRLAQLVKQYKPPYGQRDYTLINRLARRETL
ncbi:MAG: hypothetical protein ABSB96_05835 [Gaiellaceae bacterium]